MKLFKIWQTENNGYDTYDSAVVAAESKEDAVTINPADPSYYSWVSSDKVSVELLGTAKPGTKRGVICASFNAG